MFIVLSSVCVIVMFVLCGVSCAVLIRLTAVHAGPAGCCAKAYAELHAFSFCTGVRLADAREYIGLLCALWYLLSCVFCPFDKKNGTF